MCVAKYLLDKKSPHIGSHRRRTDYEREWGDRSVHTHVYVRSAQYKIRGSKTPREYES